MSTVAVLIALFTAAQTPTIKNCNIAAEALIEPAIKDSWDPKQEVHLDEDIHLIKAFLTKCKGKAKK